VAHRAVLPLGARRAWKLEQRPTISRALEHAGRLGGGGRAQLVEPEAERRVDEARDLELPALGIDLRDREVAAYEEPAGGRDRIAVQCCDRRLPVLRPVVALDQVRRGGGGRGHW